MRIRPEELSGSPGENYTRAPAASSVIIWLRPVHLTGLDRIAAEPEGTSGNIMAKWSSPLIRRGSRRERGAPAPPTPDIRIHPDPDGSTAGTAKLPPGPRLDLPNWRSDLMRAAVGRMVDVRNGGRRRLVRLTRPSADRWRCRVIDRGIDVTDILSARRTLVLAPHPDDETFGVGATIARCRAAGVSVMVVIASDGRRSHASRSLTPDELAAIRATEVRAACRAMGVAEADLMELGFEDGTLEAHCSALARQLRGIVLDYQPAQILVPSVHDGHPDHRGLHRALLCAVADGPLMACDILAYPVWAWASGPWFLDVAARKRPKSMLWALRWAFGSARPLLVRTDSVLNVKREAMRAHATQTTNYTGEPTWNWLRPEFCDLFAMSAEVLFPVRT